MLWVALSHCVLMPRRNVNDPHRVFNTGLTVPDPDAQPATQIEQEDNIEALSQQAGLSQQPPQHGAWNPDQAETDTGNQDPAPEAPAPEGSQPPMPDTPPMSQPLTSPSLELLERSPHAAGADSAIAAVCHRERQRSGRQRPAGALTLTQKGGLLSKAKCIANDSRRLGVADMSIAEFRVDTFLVRDMCISGTFQVPSTDHKYVALMRLEECEMFPGDDEAARFCEVSPERVQRAKELSRLSRAACKLKRHLDETEQQEAPAPARPRHSGSAETIVSSPSQ